MLGKGARGATGDAGRGACALEDFPIELGVLWRFGGLVVRPLALHRASFIRAPRPRATGEKCAGSGRDGKSIRTVSSCTHTHTRDSNSSASVSEPGISFVIFMFPYSFPNVPVTVWRVAVLMLAIELEKKKCLESFSLGFRPLLKKKKRKITQAYKKREGVIRNNGWRKGSRFKLERGG